MDKKKYQPNIKRLQKLHDYVANDKSQEVKVFDFSIINGTDLSGLPSETTLSGIHYCGTNGCLMGYMPLIWKSWTFDFFEGIDYAKNRPRKGELHGDWNEYLEKWFGISERDSLHLFYPNQQDPKYGDTILGSDAGREEVLENLQTFIEYHSPKAWDIRDSRRK